MAVYTEVDDAALVEFMAAYDLGDVLACKGIAEGIENTNFVVTTTSGPFILTLYEKRVNPGDLPFFLGLKTALATAGVPCPVPIETRTGETLRRLSDRPAALISFLPGMSARRPTAEHCFQVGQAIAQLHMAGIEIDLRRENDLGPLSWRPLLEQAAPAAENEFPGIGARLKISLADILDRWPAGLPVGIIHADLFPDNVFFRQGYLSGLIDFYFACTDVLAYDLAVCLNAWCFEPDKSFNVTKARRLIAGYRSVRTMTAEELAAIPVLARGAAMRFLLTRLYDWTHTPSDALVTPKDPTEYLQRLEFHEAARGPQSYGIDD